MASTGQVGRGTPSGDATLHAWRPASLVKPSILKSLMATADEVWPINTPGTLSAAGRQRPVAVLNTLPGADAS